MKSDKIANCKFAFECPRSWDELTVTDTETIRLCSVCDRDVYLAEDEEAFGLLAAAGKCAALRNDLEFDSVEGEQMGGFLLGIPASPSNGRLTSATWPLHIDCAQDALRGKAPGYVLNDNNPGSDGNYYSIERSADGKNLWDLFQCIPEHFFAAGFTVLPIAIGVSVEELYRRLESVDIFILGHEAIALGLPFHGDNY